MLDLNMQKEKYNPDYMIIMNNDVLIDAENFLDQIEKIHSETEFDVLGPDVFAKKNQFHQNPLCVKNLSRDEVKKHIKYLSIYSKHPLLTYTTKQIKSKLRIRTRIKKIIKNRKDINLNEYTKARILNPVLHGACLIFSKSYICNETEAFDSRTYLYSEEYILNYKCIKKGYTMVYDSSISVIHLEGFSTDTAISSKKQYLFWNKNKYNKFKFQVKCFLQSRKVLLEVIDRNAEE